MKETKPAGVQSVSRALNLLALLGQNEDGMRVSDLASRANLAVSTTHRLLTTLEMHGFALFDPLQKRWQVGSQAYSVGAAYGQRRSFIAAALPFLRQLRDHTKETANLGVLEDSQLTTLSQVESREIMRAISPPGGRVPVFCSGMGKAILSTWSDADIATFSERVGFAPLTRYSHRSLGALMEDIADIRACGYAVDDEQHLTGLRCVAAPVYNAQGEAVCAISISGLSLRLLQDRLPSIGDAVHKAAQDFSSNLRGSSD